MLKKLKQRVLMACRTTRVLDAVAASEWRRRRLLILCYHSLSVDQEHEWRRALFFTPEEFQARLDLIHRYRLNVLPLEEALARLRAGTLPPRSAALTFDDGSADFHNLVVPMLARFGYPATVYITTYYLEKRLPISCVLFWLENEERPTETSPWCGWREVRSGATTFVHGRWC